MLREVLFIQGKPGLYRLISQGRNMLIVESLDAQKRRQPSHPSDRITSLAEISIYTLEGEMPLPRVLEAIKEKEGGKALELSTLKTNVDKLKVYFAEVVPHYDVERVHLSDMKKVLAWYNILIEAGIDRFEEKTEAASEEAAPEA